VNALQRDLQFLPIGRRFEKDLRARVSFLPSEAGKNPRGTETPVGKG